MMVSGLGFRSTGFNNPEPESIPNPFLTHVQAWLQLGATYVMVSGRACDPEERGARLREALAAACPLDRCAARARALLPAHPPRGCTLMYTCANACMCGSAGGAGVA